MLELVPLASGLRLRGGLAVPKQGVWDRDSSVPDEVIQDPVVRSTAKTGLCSPPFTLTGPQLSCTLTSTLLRGKEHATDFSEQIAHLSDARARLVARDSEDGFGAALRNEDGSLEDTLSGDLPVSWRAGYLKGLPHGEQQISDRQPRR